MTTMALPMPRSQSWWLGTVAAGAALGLAYTLSPLTVLSLAVLAYALHAAGRGLSADEQRWFWCVMAISVVWRLAAIAGLFWFADPSRPFASFFGDEELYKFRTVWLRNVGQGIPMSPADVIYSFDDVGHTSYIYVFAFVQALVGDAPYGLHVLNMTLYLCGVLGLYRFVRVSYGGVVAMAGLVALLCLPSLAIWSISLLKEPMNVFMLIGELMCAVAVVRAPRWAHKALAVAGVLIFGLAMESLRGGGWLTAVAGLGGGLLLSFVLARGRRLLLVTMLVPIVIAAAATRPSLQDRALANIRNVAYYHAGHVVTPGYSYQLLDRGYYHNRTMVLSLPPVDAARFVIKAVASYFAEPLPWRSDSRVVLAYLSEQFLWYLMVLAMPFGVLAGLRRDRVLTSMLLAHAAAAVTIVALTSGNIGTLIRHRSLALPYLVWFSVLGAIECTRLCVDRSAHVNKGAIDGDR